jgi:hypothetical protein
VAIHALQVCVHSTILSRADLIATGGFRYSRAGFVSC